MNWIEVALPPMGFSRQENGVGCHFLLQGIFPTQGLNPGLPHCGWVLYQLSYQGTLKQVKQQVIFSSRFLPISSSCHRVPHDKIGGWTTTGGHRVPQRPSYMMETIHAVARQPGGHSHSCKCAPRPSIARMKSNMNCPLRFLSWQSGPLPTTPHPPSPQLFIKEGRGSETQPFHGARGCGITEKYSREKVILPCATL